jgi:hypothetical protein
LDQVDMSQQSNDDISQVGSYSLARCIKILMCNERRHWALMVSLFIPCLLGGKWPITKDVFVLTYY